MFKIAHFVRGVLGARMHEKYLNFYREDTDRRVRQDPKKAIGGRWDEIGELQFLFLTKQGLQPHHRLLDVGCGTLRGGRHFIRYLNADNYFGFEISRGALAEAHKLIDEENLHHRSPRLILNADGRLRFREMGGQKFDFILAQSVFTHLPAYLIEECIAHVGAILKDDGHFYFTYREKCADYQTTEKDFAHTRNFFDRLAAVYGFNVDDLSSEYGHPRGQRMLCFMKINKARKGAGLDMSCNDVSILLDDEWDGVTR